MFKTTPSISHHPVARPHHRYGEMESHQHTRNVLPRRSKPKGKGRRFFLRKEDAGPDNTGDNSSGPPANTEPPGPPQGKGKGKGLFRNPFFTITLGFPTTSTVTTVSTSTFTLAPPPAETTTVLELPPTTTIADATVTPIIILPGTTLTTITTTPAPSVAVIPSSEPSLSTSVTSVPSGTTYYADWPTLEPTPLPPVEAIPQTQGLSSNQVVGIVLGSIFGFIFIASLLFFFCRNSRRTPFFLWRRGTQHGHIRIDSSAGLPPTTRFAQNPFDPLNQPSPTPPPILVTLISKPKQVLTTWFARIRQPVRDPLKPQREKTPSRFTAPNSRVSARSVFSIFRNSSVPTPPSGTKRRSGRSTPSTGGGPSRFQHRQSAISDNSLFAGAADMPGNESGTFVAPTPLTCPKPAASTPLREIQTTEREDGPGPRFMPPPRTFQVLRVIRRYPEPPNRAVNDPRGRASLVSVDSRDGI